MSSLLTILEPAEDEFIEKKSKFIGYIAPCSNEEEANAFIKKINQKHFDATHNCYAYDITINESGNTSNISRSSDDGEPSGTAGRPILEVIKGAGLTNVCVVVTRYFGGTLLGTGGLVRAYQEGAKIAINASKLGEKISASEMSIVLDYSMLPKFQNLFQGIKGEISNIIYQEKVNVLFLVANSEIEKLKKSLQEMVGGELQLATLNPHSYFIVEKE